MVLRVKHSAENSTKQPQEDGQRSTLGTLWNGFRVTPTDSAEHNNPITTEHECGQLRALFQKLEKLNHELSSVVLKGQSDANYTCLLEELNHLVANSGHKDTETCRSPAMNVTDLVKNDLVDQITKNKQTHINITREFRNITNTQNTPAVDEEPPKNVIYLSKSAQWLRHNPEIWTTFNPGMAEQQQTPNSATATENYPPSVASTLQKMRIQIQNFESSQPPNNIDIGYQLAEMTQQILISGKYDLSTEKDITLNLIG